MKKNLIIVIAIICNACAYHLGDLEPENLNNEPATLKFPFNIESLKYPNHDEQVHKLTIPCTIEFRSGNCIFDTGLKGLMVNSCFANVTPRWSSDTDSVGASGKIHQVEHRRISSLILSSAIYHDVFADLNIAKDCGEIIGLIGSDVFKHQLFIDIDRKQLSDQNPGILLNQKLNLKSGFFIIQTKVRGELFNALVDTGATSSIVDENILEKMELLYSKPYDYDENLQDINGEAVPIKKAVRANISIAEKNIANVFFSAIDLQSVSNIVSMKVDMVIGMNVIKMLNWGFDLEENTWGVSLIGETSNTNILPNDQNAKNNAKKLSEKS